MVASYFGIVSHGINGVTINSLLELLIRSKNCCELKSSLLTDMQAGMANICCLIIAEFSIIGQSMLGWIDDRRFGKLGG